MARTVSPRSINAKLGRLVVVAIAAAMLLVAGLSLAQETAQYLDGKRASLLATASAFSAASAQAVAARDEGAAARALRGIATVPGIAFATIADADGGALASLGSGVRLAGDLDLTERDGGTRLRLLTTRTVSVSVPVWHAGEEVGRLTLVAEASDLWDRLLDVLWTTGAGALGALAVGLAISLRLQRSITRPLIALSEAMRTIQSTHDYATRVAIASDDEVGVLAGSFNAMIAEVRARDQLLGAHRDRLEQDVAERTRDLRLAKDEAEAANGAKSEFLATMSHEIRTPMNGMLVMAELLAASDLPDRERRYAEVIARSGQSLLAIINDILDFSKIEAGKLTLEAIPFAPTEVIDTVVTLFAERAAASGLDLAARIDPDLPAQISGDPVRLTQVLGNLVNNALKFTTSGHVLVSAGWHEGALRFCVTDTGIGIPAAKVGTIFEAFSQADQSTTRRFGGTGLGLSICKRIVDAMEGSVAVTSVEGEGSTFTVALPAGGARPRVVAPTRAPRPVALHLAGAATREGARHALARAGFGLAAETDETDPAGSDLVADTRTLLRLGRRAGVRVVGVAGLGDPSGAEALRRGLADVLIRWPVVQAEWGEVLAHLADGTPFATDAARPRQEVGDAALAGLRVLVADDGAVNREVACEALARLGIAAEAVQDGRAALSALAQGRFDAVLMDGSMPDLDGYAATRLLRAEEARSGRPRLPVIALTAHVVGAAADAWRAAGMDDALHKPFTVAKLADILRRNLALDGCPADAATPPILAHEAETDGLLDADTLANLEEMAAAGAGASFLARVLGLFIDGAPAQLADLRETVERGEADAVAASAHRLKSMALNVGGARLAMVLGTLEGNARDAAILPDAAAFAQVEACLAQTLAALRARLPAQTPETRAA